MEYGLLIVFMYGVLHAFGPDHLTAIADFSIGKQRQRVLWITVGFALGHGISLYLFALLLSQFDIPESWLAYGDVAAASVIIGMGLYLIFLALTNRIHVAQHEHEGKAHVHIWFGRQHHHHGDRSFLSWLSASSLMGVLMGMGGARGMLVSLSALSTDEVTGWMVLSFTLGVGLIFVLFGLGIAWLNQRMQVSAKLLKGSFFTTGVISCFVGAQVLI